MKKLIIGASLLAAFAAQADILDRPTGFRIGQHMTIRPYVAMYYTWDSNVQSSHEQGSYSSFNINPGFSFAYKADNWSLLGGAYYQYHAYTENSQNLNEHSYGENLAFSWTNSRNGGRGWTLLLRESFQKISQDDDMTNDGGRGIGRDRWQLQAAATLQRRITDQLHADVDLSYYYIDYDNKQGSYAPMYGWQRYTLGAQVGYALTKWTDFLIMGNYQGFYQDNCQNAFSGTQIPSTSNDSNGFTIHAGVGSYATERISYRLSGGYSYFDYAGGAANEGGFTYTATGHWRMTDRWNMMLLGSSYFQPSESELGSFMRVDSFSWGVAHSMVRDKLTGTLDLTYRHEDRQCATSDVGDRVNDIITARLGLNWQFNRFLAMYGHVEYQTYIADAPYIRDNSYDYDRWRLTLGLRLTY